MNLIGDFGDAVNGPTPVAIRSSARCGKAPGARRWRALPSLPQADVEPLSGGPYIVDAWTLTPALYRGDRNRCTVGKTFVRVMWSNGLTAYPTGVEVGAAVVASYRALYELPTAGSSRWPRSTSPTSTIIRPRPTPTTCTTLPPAAPRAARSSGA